ncbi:hypothetical protein [Glaciimonas sp. PCH181]|uniref:hypothetical protein n=1 Tax=Glaciimonas sp. PCH181 TaxID=2133943 RepID=UPI000D34411D|nr:hypothetical protein [Glaciimonas sp. PCH181]PUA17305.1 hypothetical protein C7W93_15370 [Glaciimonas sp. PCH181]
MNTRFVVGLISLVAVALLFFAYAMTTNANQLPDLTPAEVEADKHAQLAQLCKLEWPDVKGGIEARRIACKHT